MAEIEDLAEAELGNSPPMGESRFPGGDAKSVCVLFDVIFGAGRHLCEPRHQ